MAAGLGTRAASNPGKRQELAQTLYQLDAQMVDPLWPYLMANPIPIDYPLNQIPEGDSESVIWNN